MTARWKLGAFIFAALAGPALGAATVEPGDRDRAEARDLEQQNQWDRASEIYLRLLADDRQQPDLRERLTHCLRRLQQTRRHADPAYRAYAASLPLSQAVALYAEAVATIQQNYVAAGQVMIERLYRSGLEEFRAALTDPVFRREQMPTTDVAALSDLRQRLDREWPAKLSDDLREIRQMIRDLAWQAQQLTGVNPSIVILEFVHGACHAIDEYTNFITPGRAAQDASSLNSELTAYGLMLANKDGYLVVERVVSGSWAATAGLAVGDRITSVVRTKIDQHSLDELLELARGERTSISEFVVAATDSTDGRTIALPETLPSVIDGVMARDSIGYVRIGYFQKTTPQEFDSALLRLRSEGMRALVLDLRGNPGGSFLAAVHVAERLLAQGVIVSTQGQLRGMTKTFTAQNAAVFDGPVIVLVDGETASAAEVLAGALHDQQRGILVGQRTFGKDSIQRLWQFNEGGILRLTMARFLPPGGRSFAGVGVEPNVIEPRRDAMRDYQLETAIEQASRLLAMR
jgi:carboxyl-terminal processing protease